jgi:phasin
MAANTKKTEDAFSVTAFDPSRMSDSMRQFAEKGAAQSKDAYARMKTAAEDASKTAEATLQSAQSGTVELGLKAIEAMRVNTENTLSHMEALLGVKSVSELFELQTSFFRKQAELVVEQARAMQEVSRSVAERVSQPTRTAAEKAMSDLKQA